MWRNKKEDKNKPLVLILDIESGNIRSLLLEDKKSNDYLHSECLPSPFLEYDEDTRQEKALFNQIKKLGNKITKTYPTNDLKVHCLLPTHLVDINTTILRYKNLNRKNIDSDYIYNLSRKNSEKYLHKFKNSRHIVDDVILNSQTEKEDLKIHHYISSVEEHFINKLVDSIRDSLRIRTKPIFHSRPLAHFSTITKHLNNTPSLTLIDCAGETTDILVIKEGNLHQVGWIPVGKHLLIKRMARLLEVSPHHLTKELELIQEGFYNSQFKKILQHNSEEIIKEWLFEIKDLLNIKKEDTIHLLGDDAISYFLAESINNYEDEPKVEIVDKEWLDRYLLGKKYLDNSLMHLFANYYL